MERVAVEGPHALVGRRGRGFAVGLALVLATAAGAAAPAPIEGRVVELYGEDLVLDLSSVQGAKAGAVVELWRPVKLKHPVTGEELSDRFLIGQLRLTQVRETLSLARPVGKLSRAPEPGDIVLLAGAKSADKSATAPTPVAAPKPGPASIPTPPAPAAAPSTPPGTGAQPAPAPAPDGSVAGDAEVSALLDAVKGKGVRARILAYEAYVRKRPRGRHAAVLWEEARQLRRLVAMQSEGREKQPALRSFEAPGDALAGIPISIGIQLGDAKGALLHSRLPSEVSYVSAPMTAAGDGYFTATLPAERVKRPGVEYFIEATKPDGTAVAVAGESRSPLRLKVIDAPRPEPPPPHDAVLAVWTDYASWNAKEANDYIWQTEGFAGIRLRDTGVRALRSGFGVYRGRGGSLRELDEQDLDGRDVGLTYGYLELEYGISHFTGLIGRGVVGLQNAGVAGGVQLLLRLGSDRGTNLMIGGEVLGSIGLRGITQLELANFPRFPIVLRTEVTNQPAGERARSADDAGPEDSVAQGEVGARAIAQIGYRVVPALTVSIRGSYQGRTINHAGPGAGGGITFTW